MSETSIVQGKTGHAVVLLHGLCGTHMELGSIPKALQRSEHTVVVPYIPGYADTKTCSEWESWVERTELLIDSLLENHDSISLCGLSMGATLALAVAAKRDDIQSMVLLSPILRYDGWAIAQWQLAALRVAYHLGVRDWVWREKDPYGIRNLELRRRVAKAVEKGDASEVGAATLSARHLYQAQNLMRHVRKSLEEVRADTLVIHAVDDETAAPRGAEAILAQIKSETRRAIWLGDCYHIITVDNERELVTNETLRFIENIRSQHLSDKIHRLTQNRQKLRDRRA